MRRFAWWVVGGLVAITVIAGGIVAARVVQARQAQARLRQRLEQTRVLEGQKQYAEAIGAYRQLITDAPQAPQAREARLAVIDLAIRLERWVDAKTECLAFLQSHPGDPESQRVTQRLGEVNLAILMSPIPTPESVEYAVQSGDTLGGIAKRFNTTVPFLIKTNRLKSTTLHPGVTLKAPNRVRWEVVVDKSLNLLTLKMNGQVLKTYRVSTGNNNITPIGTFKVINKVVNPVWYKDGAAIPPDAPENILGSRWMGFDKPGYGIHGTTQPESLGQQVTAGCVRMLNREVEELFDIVPLGADVTVVD